MRIYFSPCGIGLGHVGRCIPIARELEKKGAETAFSTYREGLQYLRQEGIPVIEAPPIGFQVKPDGTIDFRQTAANPGPFVASFTLTQQVVAEIEAIKRFRPDLVVSDSRFSPLLAAQLLGIPRISILNQFQIIVPRRSRFLRLAKLADFITLALIGKVWTSGIRVLIPDLPPPYTISMGNLRIPNSYRHRVKLIGPILPLRSDELPTVEKIRSKLGLGDKLVIFAPISGPPKERAYFTGILRKIFLSFPDDYEVVMSLGYPNSYKTSSPNPIRRGNLTVFKWVPNRFEYLKACDLVISRAGHNTLLQSICYGKPMILVPTPSHTEQLNNARRAVELEVAKMVEQTDLSRKTLLNAVREILENDQTYEKVKRIQEEVSDLNGLEIAVKTILDAVQGKF